MSKTIKQNFIDLETIKKLQDIVDQRFNKPEDLNIKMEFMLTFSFLRDCFKNGFIEKVENK